MMVTYTFSQATDKEGQMTGIPRGGKITIRVKAMNDGNPDLLHWMIQQALPKNGRITNTDVQEMAKVSKPTATRLLTSLSDYLEVRGTTGKGTYYVVKGLIKGSNFTSE